MPGKENENVIFSILEGLPIFSDLDENSLRALSQYFDEKIYEKGEMIFPEGSLGSSMMIIASGEVRITQKADETFEEALIILKKGDIFGEMGLLEELPRTADTIANSDVIIYEISHDHFLKYINLDPHIGINILLKLARILSSRLREADVKIKTFVNLSKWI